jgi:transcriptional regulator with XRE-family HTH domain
VNQDAPSVRLELLSAEVKRLREAAGKSGKDAAQAARINRATLSKIENAHARPQEATLTALLDLYGVTGWKREYLHALREEGNSPGWLQPLVGEIAGEYTAFIYLESKARVIRCFETLIIPGLLQTAAYARALVAGAKQGASADQVGARVRIRMERQKRLREGGVHFDAVFTEASLRYLVGGPDIMRGQLAHLLELADAPNVSVRVIPLGSDAHPSMMASYVVLEFQPGNPSIVYLESATEARFLEQATHVERYGAIHDQLHRFAVDPGESKRLIRQRLIELEEGVHSAPVI